MIGIKFRVNQDYIIQFIIKSSKSKVDIKKQLQKRM